MRYTGGPVVATGRIVNYILFAYKIADASQYPLIDAELPKWAQEKRYHLVARSPVLNPTKDQLRLMVQQMLSERFRLKLHTEQRDETVYELRLAKGRPGPQLKPHEGKAVCGVVSAATFSEKSKDAHPPYCGPMVWMNEGLTHLRIMDFSMEQMAGQLSPIGASFGGNEAIPVVDHTGLAGKWDLDVEFQRAKKRAAAANDEPTQEFGMDFTQALGVQDGLVLRKTRDKVPFVVVDRVEVPSDN